MGKLKEELDRFNAINKYAEKLIIEQETPNPEDPTAAPTDATVPPAGEAPAGPPEGAAEVPAAGENPEAGAPAPEAAPGDAEVASDVEADDSTEEIDITDLVNMTKSIKKQLDDTQGKDSGAIQKMDDVFSKLSELETKLADMDNVIAKIDQLGAELKDIKPKTPVEKLEMRSLDSYPFNQNPNEFFADKQQEMRASGKNEYVLTKGDVEDYGKNEIMKSFNPSVKDTTMF